MTLFSALPAGVISKSVTPNISSSDSLFTLSPFKILFLKLSHLLYQFLIDLIISFFILLHQLFELFLQHICFFFIKFRQFLLTENAWINWKSFLKIIYHFNRICIGFKNTIWLFLNSFLKLLHNFINFKLSFFNIFIFLARCKFFILSLSFLNLLLAKSKDVFKLLDNLISTVITHINWKHKRIFLIDYFEAAMLYGLLIDSLDFLHFFFIFFIVWFFGKKFEGKEIFKRK